MQYGGDATDHCREFDSVGQSNSSRLEQQLGTNPSKFGMVGWADTHTALAKAAEENFIGKPSGLEPSPRRIDHPMAKFDGWAYVEADVANRLPAVAGHFKGAAMGGSLSERQTAHTAFFYARYPNSASEQDG